MRYEYRCPREGCSSLLFKADDHVAATVEVKCHGCGGLVEPTHERRPLIRRYRCTNCQREQTVERPKNEKTHCLVCGTPSLAIVGEAGAEQTRETQAITAG